MNSWETATLAVGKKCIGVTSSKEGHREIEVVPFHRVMWMLCDVGYGMEGICYHIYLVLIVIPSCLAMMSRQCFVR
eukprot:scaffold246196_cov43-Cyclotella_meneghiniana.AAC.1